MEGTFGKEITGSLSLPRAAVAGELRTHARDDGPLCSDCVSRLVGIRTFADIVDSSRENYGCTMVGLLDFRSEIISMSSSSK